jgi:hypothetical protein
LNLRIHIILVSAFIMTVMSCYEPQEGCLDQLSSNFDALADNECAECCTYPNIEINLLHINGQDSTFEINDSVVNNLGYKIKVLESKLYLSQFGIYQSGTKFVTRNRMVDSLNGASLLDDVIFLRPQDLTLRVGEYRFAGKVDSIGFDIGLRDSLLKGNFNRVAAGHPLNIRNEIVNADDKRSIIILKLFDILQPKDTITLSIIDAASNVRFINNKVKATLNGQNIRANMSAHYQNLLKDINLKLTKQENEVILRRNLSSFLSVR